MEHHFNTSLAQEYGIEEAILINNLFYWIHKNACNNKHCHEERFWTYNTTKAFAALFPYMNETKIFRSLKHLEECGFIIKGNFNEMKMDRTCWYAFTDFGVDVLCNLGYDAMHFVKMKNAYSQNEITLPNSNTTNKNKNKESITPKRNEYSEDFERAFVLYERKGSKADAYKRWQKLTEEEKELVFKHIPHYLSAHQVQYRKDFSGYLNKKYFNDVVYKNNVIIYDPNEQKPTIVESKRESIVINGQIYR